MVKWEGGRSFVQVHSGDYGGESRASCNVTLEQHFFFFLILIIIIIKSLKRNLKALLHLQSIYDTRENFPSSLSFCIVLFVIRYK